MDSFPEPLPEFEVTLRRIKQNETAYPQGPDVAHYEHQGQRSKFGGFPERLHEDRKFPECPECGDLMHFVAQIDSIEHEWPSNPHAGVSEQRWMFGDVGMLYVFFCFDCMCPHAEVDT